MNTYVRSNYAGMLPDELPANLSNKTVASSLDIFFSNNGSGVRVTRDGSLKMMNCVEKVCFYILDFFGLCTLSRDSTVQYHVIKLLHVAKSREMLQGALETTISEARIKNLLLGVSEAIHYRHNTQNLKKCPQLSLT